jgi:hypothetical protein
MTNAELIRHLAKRGIEARIFQFDNGQTLVLPGFLNRVTSEWGDRSLYELVRDRNPEWFPEDDPFVDFEPVTVKGY